MGRALATVAFVSLPLLFAVLPADAGPTDAQKCEAGKLNELAKYNQCRLKADSKAAKKRATADFTKCDGKLADKWSSLEAKYGAACPTLGDQAALQAQAAACCDAVAGVVAPPKVVFVAWNGVLGGWAGNFSGVAFADSICNSRASTAGLPGTFKAWLSDSTSSPATSFTQYKGRYESTNGSTIANNWADLTDGALDSAILWDENGIVRVGVTWTNTLTDGTFDGAADCADWTTVLGFTGGSGCNATDATWTDCGPIGCSSDGHFYCFEQ